MLTTIEMCGNIKSSNKSQALLNSEFPSEGVNIKSRLCKKDGDSNGY